MLSDERLHHALRVTFTYVLVSVPLQLVAALGLAMLLDGDRLVSRMRGALPPEHPPNNPRGHLIRGTTSTELLHRRSPLRVKPR